MNPLEAAHESAALETRISGCLDRVLPNRRNGRGVLRTDGIHGAQVGHQRHTADLTELIWPEMDEFGLLRVKQNGSSDEPPGISLGQGQGRSGQEEPRRAVPKCAGAKSGKRARTWVTRHASQHSVF
jgi:hypothetical protein